MQITQVRVQKKDDPTPAFPEVVQTGKVFSCQLDRVAVLQGGMDSGRSSISILIDLPNGDMAFIQTSAINFERISAIVRGACQSWGEDCTV